uniref:Vesicle-fusing ATPase n=1 Tax=Aceria tosichella TaxID=561515 RepID=A0A6G1SMT4_9ACAR
MNLEQLINYLNQTKMEQYTVISCPTTPLSYTNRAILNPNDPFAQFEHIAIRYPKKNEAFVFTVITDRQVDRGKIAFNLSGRKWASLQTNSIIEAAPYKFVPQSQCLNTITFFTDFANRANVPSLEFDTDAMAKQFSQQFTNQAFTVGQLFGFAFDINNKKVVFELKVKEMEAVNIEQAKSEIGTANVEIGLTTANTVILFEPGESSGVKLIGGMTGKMAAPQMFTQNWDFANMGIGGLSEQFNKIFRRAFITRLLPPQFAEETGTEHIRGILLYGPPGTGKTLIARQIGKMLLAREPKIVNGPEVLNKFVGESEANIRKLFAEAEEEQAKMGINSGLHVIIFDEIDSICKARGNSASSSGAGDNVVNQLLSKIDGVNSLHNVLLIGMTNRRDLIDEALLRPGRLELQIEVGLPNKHGRLEILSIHTAKMRKKNLLDQSVDLEELAEHTKNYTGAEIAGLVKAANTLAINRVIKVGQDIKVDGEVLNSIKITRNDFQFAMEHDIKPALGANEDHLKELARPIIHWDPTVGTIQSNLYGIIKHLSNPDADEKRPYFVLLVGQPGAGLTTIAANMAKETQFPFIRVYQARATASKTESAKVQYMEKLFEDASRSELSCIVMDGLETILDYCHIGPRFSNTSRALFTESKDLILPKGHKMLVICTCKSEQFLNDLQLADTFDYRTQIPSLTKPEQVRTVLMQLQETGDSTFTPKQTEELVEALESIPFKMGIKKLERLIKDATQDEPGERVRKLIERMHMLQIVVRTSRLDRPFEF